MPYVGREANSFTTVVDVTVSDDLTVTDDATIGGDLAVTDDATIGGALSAKGGAVFNEDSADVDFRIETNNQAHTFFVDGETDLIGIGGVTGPDGQFTIASTNSNTPRIRFQHPSVTGDASIDTFQDGGGTYMIIGTNSYFAVNGAQVKFNTGEEANHWYFDPSGPIVAFTATASGNLTERMRVTSTAGANLRVSDGINLLDGNLVVASGHGIDFSATSGSPTSELFDDYEEGTFTPGLKDALNGNAAGAGATSGRYTKIGRVVNFSFAIQVNSLSGMTAGNVLNVTDLPYVVNNDSAGGAEPHAQILSFINNLDSADYAGSIVLRPNNNTTSCELKYTAGGAVTAQGFTSLLVQDIAANTFLTGAATYETT